MGLLYQGDFTFLLRFSLFPVGSDGAFGPHFAPWGMFGVTPCRNHLDQGPNCNGSGMAVPFAGYFPSQPLCNPKSRWPQQDTEMKAPRRGHFGMEVEKPLRNCSEEVPSPSQLLVFNLNIQNKGRGAQVGGFSPTSKGNDSPSPTTGCMGTVTHRCVGTSRVDFYPSRNLLENLLLVV